MNVLYDWNITIPLLTLEYLLELISTYLIFILSTFFESFDYFLKLNRRFENY